MKIVNDTLQLLVETWDDPGDYPNSLAAGPLPSYNYVTGVEGELQIELSAEEMEDFRETLEVEDVDFWMYEIVDYRNRELFDVASWKWQLDNVVGNIVTVSIVDRY